MTKPKANKKQTVQALARHKFDTSSYIVMDRSVRRDSSSGRLIVMKASGKGGSPKSK